MSHIQVCSLLKININFTELVDCLIDFINDVLFIIFSKYAI